MSGILLVWNITLRILGKCFFKMRQTENEQFAVTEPTVIFNVLVEEEIRYNGNHSTGLTARVLQQY